MKKITFILILASLLATEVSAKNGVVDTRDKQNYPVVTINGKKWLAKNLSYAGANGELGTCERKSFHYPTKTADCNAYGKLYTWAEAKTQICPKGWRVPSKAEWEALIAFAGGNETAGKKLRTKEDWFQYGKRDSSGTNDYGFSALPAGKLPTLPPFICAPSDPRVVCSAPPPDGYFSVTAWWWSSTETDVENAYSFRIGSWRDVNNASVVNYDKSHKMSVRCVEDN